MKKALLSILLLAGLSGCAMIIGRHPDTVYQQRYCYPCIEAARTAGIGISYTPEVESKWRRINLMWDYDHWWKKTFGWEW